MKIEIISAIHPMSVLGSMPSPAPIIVAEFPFVKPSLVTAGVVVTCFVATVCVAFGAGTVVATEEFD